MGSVTYTLKLDGVDCVEINALDSDHDRFMIMEIGIDGYTGVDGYHFKKDACDFELDGECATLVTLTADDGSTIQKRLDEVFRDDQMIFVDLLYTVME